MKNNANTILWDQTSIKATQCSSTSTTAYNGKLVGSEIYGNANIKAVLFVIPPKIFHSQDSPVLCLIHLRVLGTIMIKEYSY